MTKPEALAWMKRTKIVPVIRAESPEQALQIADLLHEGGIDIFEVTLTVPGAVEVIRRLSQEFQGRALIGAGTVLDESSSLECVANGANFVVAPNTSPEVIRACRESDILCAPGALTPTEVLFAHSLGADLVKVFPCDAVGGPGYIKALKAPLPNIELLPTGGVALDNVCAFLKAGACCVGVGTNLVDLKALKQDPRKLVDLARAFLEAAGGVSAT